MRSPEDPISRSVADRHPGAAPGTLPSSDIHVPRTPRIRSSRAVNAVIAVATLATAATGTAVGLDKAATGHFPWEQNQGNVLPPINTPSPSETAYQSQIIEAPTPKPSAQETPQETATPSPKPTETLPPSIEKVPINKYATIDMLPYPKPPFYYLSVDKATVVAIPEKEPDGNLWFAISTYGNKITKQYCSVQNMTNDWITQHYGAGKSVPVTTCEFQGATLWLEVNKDTRIYDVIAQQPFGQGVDSAIPYLKVGQTLKTIQIGLTDEPNSNIKGSLLTMNLDSWNKLQNSVGESFPRSDRIFSFYASGLGVVKK